MFRLLKEDSMCVCVCVHMRRRAAQSTEIVLGKYSLRAATRSAQAFKKASGIYICVLFLTVLCLYQKTLSM